MFTNAYYEEVYELENFCNANKRLRVILYAKYKRVDLHKVMKTQCQHLKIIQHNELLKILQKTEEFLMEHFVPVKQIQ